MPLLDAMIAFSLTMLAVATAVSVLIEIVQGLVVRRRAGLKKFLHEFYTHELEPAVHAGVARAEQKVKDASTAAVHAALDNLQKQLGKGYASTWGRGANSFLPPAKGRGIDSVERGEGARKWAPALRAGISADFHALNPNRKLSEAEAEAAKKAQAAGAADDIKIVRNRGEVETYKLIEVSTKEMVDRLKQSALGQQIYADLKTGADEVFDVVAERYERFGEIFSETFRRNRQLASMVGAVIVAFAVNIDAIHLMKAYTLSSDTRDAVINEYSEIIAASKSVIEPPDAETNPPAEPGQTPDPPHVRETYRTAVAQLAALEASPFPIGWDYFPACPDGSPDPRCQGQKTDKEIEVTSAQKAAYVPATDGIESWALFVALRKAVVPTHARLVFGREVFRERRAAVPSATWSWIFGCLLTGLLAGLGAPFWYNAATSLMSAANRVRGSRQRLVSNEETDPTAGNQRTQGAVAGGQP